MSIKKVEVVQDQDDISGCDYIVCAPAPDGLPLIMPDNVMNFCCKCGCKVQHRPGLPPGPKHICSLCVMEDIKAEEAKGEETTMMVTQRTLDEVREYLGAHFKRKQSN